MINLAQFQQAMRDLQADKNLSDEDILKIFESIDTEKTGSINYQNFVTSAGRRSLKMCKHNIQLAFDILEKDDKITAAELMRFFDAEWAPGEEAEDAAGWQEVIDQC